MFGALTRWFRKRASASERVLVGRCRGDGELANRLIAHEIERDPRLSRGAASQRAVERWDRDR